MSDHPVRAQGEAERDAEHEPDHEHDRGLDVDDPSRAATGEPDRASTANSPARTRAVVTSTWRSAATARAARNPASRVGSDRTPSRLESSGGTSRETGNPPKGFDGGLERREPILVAHPVAEVRHEQAFDVVTDGRDLVEVGRGEPEALVELGVHLGGEQGGADDLHRSALRPELDPVADLDVEDVGAPGPEGHLAGPGRSPPSRTVS